MPSPVIEPSMNESDLKTKELIYMEPSATDAKLKAVKKKKHGLSLFLNFLLLLALGYLIFNVVQIVLRLRVFYDNELHLYISLGIFVFFYIVYAVEVFCCSTFQYLISRKQSSKMSEYVARMKETRPQLQFWGESSHTETHTYWDTDADGDDFLNDSTEEVVTHTAIEYFRYSNFHDESEKFPEEISRQQFVKMKFRKDFRFGNPETEWAYRHQYDTFIRNNQNRDLCFEHKIIFNLDNFEEKMLAINTDKQSLGARTCTFLFVSLVLLMSWPYRIWFEGLCYRREYVFKKVLYI